MTFHNIMKIFFLLVWKKPPLNSYLLTVSRRNQLPSGGQGKRVLNHDWTPLSNMGD